MFIMIAVMVEGLVAFTTEGRGGEYDEEVDREI